MAVRTNYEDVLAIMDNCTVDEDVVTTLIVASSAVVDSIFAGVSIAPVLLTEIEKWLTAHMLASTLHRSTYTEKIADAMVIFTGKWGMGLDSTPYGQMVKVLDPTGKMAKAGKSAVVIYAIKNFNV